MQSKTIAEGITAIIEYCRGIRSNGTIRGYEKACDTIRAYYEKSGQTYYNIGINNKIRDHFCGELKSNATIGYQNHRYLFRTLGMLDDYYDGHPFRDKYPFISRYKHQLQLVYQQLAEEFKENLTVRKTTVPVIYSNCKRFLLLCSAVGTL